MSEIDFTCPHCGAALVCDVSFAGQQLECSSCKGLLIAPDAPAAPRPAPFRPGAGGPRPGPRAPGGKRKPSSKRTGPSAAKVIKIVATVAVAGVILYFGFSYAITLQGKVNKERKKAEANSDGGEVGHIADLYSVLETTDPTNFEKSYMPMNRSEYGATMDSTDPALMEKQIARATEVQNLPVIAPVWTLEIDSAKTPEGRANGTVAGAEFVAESAFVTPVGQSHVLSLRQGAGVNPDQEVLIYLHLKPGETPGGQTWTISKDMQGDEVPQVVKRWTPNPKYAPKKKAFHSGYAMQLELGEAAPDGLSGKIFIALPDMEKTVVAGTFYAVLPQTAAPRGGGYNDAGN